MGMYIKKMKVKSPVTIERKRVHSKFQLKSINLSIIRIECAGLSEEERRELIEAVKNIKRKRRHDNRLPDLQFLIDCY